MTNYLRIPAAVNFMINVLCLIVLVLTWKANQDHVYHYVLGVYSFSVGLAVTELIRRKLR